MNKYAAIHWALIENARKLPHQEALVFSEGYGTESQSITNKQLLEDVVDLSAVLLDHGLGPQDRVLLMFEPGLNYVKAFLACLYAGMIAIPCYPPRSPMQVKQITGIIKNAGPKLIMMDTKVYHHVKKFHALQFFAKGLFIRDYLCLPLKPCRDLAFALTPWLICKDEEGRSKHRTDERAMTLHDVAFLQYTSGSTGFPKGVVVSHKQLISNIELIYDQFRMNDQSRGVIWLPPYHDMGLIGGILAPIYGGYPVFLMSPLQFLKSPYAWLRAVSDFRATISGGPNFAYDLAIKRLKPAQKKSLDLSSWKLAFTGAEPIKWSTMKAFSQAFEDCGFDFQAFYPCYGLAESTLFVTGKVFEEEPQALSYRIDESNPKRVIVNHEVTDSPGFKTLVSAGTINPNVAVKIVDDQSGLEMEDSQVGEIWLRGDSIGAGYWQQPELNDRQFGQKLQGQQGDFLKSGDLGFLHKGQLYISGRLKDLIILDGKNIYPQDIEGAVEQHVQGVRLGSTAAVSVDEDGQEKIIYLVEIYKDKIQSTIRDDIRLAIHRVERIPVAKIVLLAPQSLPKTTSGKIRRNLAKDMYIKGELIDLLVDAKG
jgi:acyl-CoA synthetase (AMP-forming)/AMP-acid ligase II